ncbi:unnamed protein product [Blepharisma stoltei]|uniref:Uncharacterized protein n=1 Tax=Blepharisma stoltei TaxID=1481888 RepID=A0AAU9JCH5_9CILI|nr:unnamed protein product [Blepharisma stoltei]
MRLISIFIIIEININEKFSLTCVASIIMLSYSHFIINQGCSKSFIIYGEENFVTSHSKAIPINHQKLALKFIWNHILFLQIHHHGFITQRSSKESIQPSRRFNIKSYSLARLSNFNK